MNPNTTANFLLPVHSEIHRYILFLSEVAQVAQESLQQAIQLAMNCCETF